LAAFPQPDSKKADDHRLCKLEPSAMTFLFLDLDLDRSGFGIAYAGDGLKSFNMLCFSNARMHRPSSSSGAH
jgi:hypothetical protein